MHHEVLVLDLKDLYHVIDFKFKFVYLDATNGSQTATPKLKKGYCFVTYCCHVNRMGTKKAWTRGLGLVRV